MDTIKNNKFNYIKSLDYNRQADVTNNQIEFYKRIKKYRCWEHKTTIQHQITHKLV